MTEELKGCPFCNGAAAYWEGVLCVDCGARIAFKDGTVAEHTAAWNARVPSAEVTALVEAAQAALGRMTGGMDGNWLADVDEVAMLRDALVPFKEVE